MTALDPATLRALAAELDERGANLRAQCGCAIHLWAVGLTDELAGEYRTRAIKAEQAAVSP